MTNDLFTAKITGFTGFINTAASRLRAVALMFVISISIFSCREETVLPEEFVPYISAYTGGLIAPSSGIRIELAEAQDVDLNAEIKEKLFSFSPSIEGKASWINNRTLLFIPSEYANISGKEYKAEFYLGKVMEVKKRHKTFKFNFRVENRTVDIQTFPFYIEENQSVNVKGQLRFNEKTELETVINAVSSKMSDGQKAVMAVEPTEEKNVFAFSINDIKRGKADARIEIMVTGSKIGMARDYFHTVAIPAANVFKVISTDLVSEPENGIVITFSSALSPMQDLKGLISIPELKNKFTRQVKNNIVTMFFESKGLTSITVNVDKGVKNFQGETLDESYVTTFSIEKIKPQLKMAKTGSIMPSAGNMILPFQAVSLYAVDLRIIKIYENNILMFLQSNQLNGSNELRRAGRLVYKKTVRLDNPASIKLADWQNYSIDLSTIMKQEPGAIYRIELAAHQAYSVYDCGNGENTRSAENSAGMVTQGGDELSQYEEAAWDAPSPYYYYNAGYDENYDYYYYSSEEERNDPCNASYYTTSDLRASCNVITSDIGVIAKSNSKNKWWITASNLVDAKAMPMVDITFYNYQLQPIGNAKTDADGFAVVEPKGKPFILVASAINGQKTYLRLTDGENNTLSRFDTGGKTIEKGLKGFVYGERGVWRPGDTLHITFILHDPEKNIPENHPVTLELYNARGQFATRQVLTKSVNGFYSYSIPTNANDPTGLWNAYVKVGGVTFHKPLRVETVKPNRLKINLQLPADRIDAAKENIPVSLASSWLTGATARSLKTKVEMKLTPVPTRFKGYENFVFNDPASNFSTSETTVFEGTLSEEGEAKFNITAPKAENAPGLLNANFVCRVFEQGGDASIYSQNMPYSPYSSYTGLNLNLKENSYYIETDEKHRFDIVTLNADGKPVNCENIEYEIYNIGWRWWWENEGNSLASFINSTTYDPVETGELKTVNGKASFNFTLKYPAWGRFLIYVKNHDSGHSTGAVVYIDWPSWRGRSGKSDPDNIKMLTFSTDKTSYETGDDITVIIPAAGGGGVALVALENGSTVLSSTRVPLAEEGDTKYTFKASEAMAPNFYIHISLLQPYAQTVNDLPVRMYGVMPVLITNKTSILNPQVTMPDVLRPEQEFTVEVSEKNKKAMTYTLAIVDDGLLDLTNFKTPDPWNEFYAREALGIRTWDMYDHVMGAFGGKYSSMFSTGGDEDMKPANTKANRFKPVVKYLGPFALKEGETKKHAITLPVYVGSVRTMVIAGQNGAFGKTEKTTPVRSPLMALSSLPRVIGVNEAINLPVNIFVMENSVKDVSVKVETTGLLELVDKKTQSIRFDKTGDEMVYFAMKTGRETGIEKVTVTATGGGQTSKETIEIDVRNSNPSIIHSDFKVMEAGQKTELNFGANGNSDDDWVKLEVARLPSINFTRRFDYLYDYDHKCSEQLTSCTLPLLFVSILKDVDKEEADKIKRNIQTAITKLYGRQLSDGGIVYWPGYTYASDWITSYAGCLLVMAKEKGYEVNDGVIDRWKNYQRKAAQNWAISSNSSIYSVSESQYLQAFRLYSLSLAGAPETGAMNRLKESKDLSNQARWCLAAAYAIGKKKSAAEELVFNIPDTVKSYHSRYTYGSSERDEAMILQTMVYMERWEQAFKQAKLIAGKLSRQYYMETQSTAFALMAMSSLAEKTTGVIEFDWLLNGKTYPVRTAKAVYESQLPKQTRDGNVSLTNKGKGALFVNLTSKTHPLTDSFPAIGNDLRLDVKYTDLTGKTVDITELKQGDDFIANIKVINATGGRDLSDIALTCIIPSGWEIFNERLTDGDAPAASYAYRDVRDDRVLTYFDLPRSKDITISIRLQASYIGSFVLPAIQCEAMYETSVHAKTAAGRVKVVK